MLFCLLSTVVDTEKLTLRLRDGLGSSKYKPVQYEQLQAMLEAKRITSQHIEEKVQLVAIELVHYSI